MAIVQKIKNINYVIVEVNQNALEVKMWGDVKTTKDNISTMVYDINKAHRGVRYHYFEKTYYTNNKEICMDINEYIN